MKILLVSRYKTKYVDHQAPFVTEQGLALRQAGCDVEFFLLEGNYFKAWKTLKSKMKSYQPDIVHAHYGLTGIVAILACNSAISNRTSSNHSATKVTPPKVVVTFHNGETHRWYVNFITSLFSLCAKRVIYVAQHIRDSLKFKNRNYTILPCGITLSDCVITPKDEARQKLGWSSSKKYILFGGGFCDLRKNVPLLRDAVALMQRDDIEIVELWNLNRELCFLHMSACDVFALPTKNEGSPQSLKEAMAIGCPIVATDVADISHLLGTLEGHYILSNKGKDKSYWYGDENSPSELKCLLEQALSLPFDFKTKGRDRIIQLGYTNELVAKKLISIYQDLLTK